MRMGYWALLALALCLTMGAKQADNGYWADRFDVPAEVVPGGDLRAIEQEAAKRFALAAAEQGGPGSSAEEPKTARQAERAKSELDDQDWLFIATGGLALAICSGLIYRTLRPYRRPARMIPGPTTEPPGDLAPAVAGGLRSRSAGVNWNLALATFFELAGRGHLAIGRPTVA
jgi:hypothetical protein